MLTRKGAQDIVIESCLSAAEKTGIKFYKQYVPNIGIAANRYLVLYPEHSGQVTQRETFGSNRRVNIDYEFSVGILVRCKSDKPEAYTNAESDADSILATVIETMLAHEEIALSDQDYYVGVFEKGASGAGIKIKVKVRDLNA